MNTKHPAEPNSYKANKLNTTSNIDDNENISDKENVMGLFSIEMVKDYKVCICNLCNTGLDKEREFTKHLKEKPNIFLECG